MLHAFKQRVNFFPEYEDHHDPNALNRGLLKTFLFGLIMLIALSVILAYFSRAQTTVIVVKSPTVADYSHIAGFSPSCPCSSPSLLLSDIALLKPQLLVWCNRTLPETLTSEWTAYCANSSDPDCINSFYRIRQYTTYIDTFCVLYHSILNLHTSTFNSRSIFTTSVASNDTLLSLVDNYKDQFVSDLVSNFQSFFNLIDYYEYLARPITGFGYFPFQVILNQNDPLVTPLPDGIAIQQDVVTTLGNSRDQPFYDSSASSNSSKSAVWTLVRRGNWDGAFCEATYTDQTSDESDGCSGWKYYLKFDYRPRPNEGIPPPVLPSYFIYPPGNSSLADAAVNGLLSSVDVSLNWSTYFQKCAPSQCSYTVKESPDALIILVAALGLLGGFSSVVRPVISGMVKFFSPWPVRNSLEEAKGHTQPETDLQPMPKQETADSLNY